MLDMIKAPEAPTTDITTLPPADRAALVLSSTQTEKDLGQLAENLKAITIVNSKAGRDQAHALAMTATKARTAITKIGKAAREDATKFSAAVIAEEKRLIGLISEQEDRVFGLRDAWDAAEAARKEAEARAERERIEHHQTVIATIRSYPGLARECRTAAMALQMLEKLTAIDISGLEEFQDMAREVKITADEQINDIIEAKQAAEAEAARIKAEQEAEAARLAEQARVQAEQQAELLAMQARMKAQQEELDHQRGLLAFVQAQQAAKVIQQAAEMDAIKAKAEKLAEVLADDPREALGKIMPEGLVITAHQPEPVVVQVATTVDKTEPIDEFPGQAPSAISLINVIATEYGIEPAVAISWLAQRADEFKHLNQIAKVIA